MIQSQGCRSYLKAGMAFCIVVRYNMTLHWGIILDMGSANERRRYTITSSLIGRAHTQNDPSSCQCLRHWRTFRNLHQHVSILTLWITTEHIIYLIITIYCCIMCYRQRNDLRKHLTMTNFQVYFKTQLTVCHYLRLTFGFPKRALYPTWIKHNKARAMCIFWNILHFYQQR